MSDISRIKRFLKPINIDGLVWDGTPHSRVERLLLKIYEKGGGGGGDDDKDYILDSSSNYILDSSGNNILANVVT